MASEEEVEGRVLHVSATLVVAWAGLVVEEEAVSGKKVVAARKAARIVTLNILGDVCIVVVACIFVFFFLI